MKKNVMMRVASVMLVLVLLTSSVISGTFAKYTTADTGSDKARVAVFGVEVTADFEELFKTEYATTETWTGDDGVSVKSRLGGDVLAPGTNGDLADFAVTGQPEVDVVVTYEATLSFTGDWLADKDGDGVIDDAYCPIIITVNTKDFYIGGKDLENNDITNIAGLESAVKAAIEASTAKYNAGKNLADDDATKDDLAVSWRWQFDKNVDGFLNADSQNDLLDTDLGNWEKNGKAAPFISLDITCTITQID